MTTTEDVYVVGGQYSDANNATPVILYRAGGQSSWTEVHRHSSSGAAYIYSGIHGLPDSSFIVAVGGRDVYGEKGEGFLSYSYNGATWVNATVPSNYRLMGVYVPEVDFAWVTALNKSTNHINVLAWTPDGGFTYDADLTPGGRTGAYSHIHGVSKLSGVFASAQNFNLQNRHAHRTGGAVGSGSWTLYASPGGDYGGGCYMPIHAVAADQAYGNGLDEGTSSVLGVWNGSSWSYPYNASNVGNSQSFGVCAWDGGMLLTAFHAGANRIMGYTPGGAFVTKASIRAFGIRLANNETDVIAVSDNAGTPATARFWESSDQGENWGSSQDISGYHTLQDALFTYPNAPPILIPLSPTNGETNVNVESSLSFMITSNIALTTPWTVEVDIGGGWVSVLSYNGGAAWGNGYSGTVVLNGNGATVSFSPATSLPYNTTIQIRVTATNIYSQPIELVT